MHEYSSFISFKGGSTPAVEYKTWVFLKKPEARKTSMKVVDLQEVFWAATIFQPVRAVLDLICVIFVKDASWDVFP